MMMMRKISVTLMKTMTLSRSKQSMLIVATINHKEMRTETIIQVLVQIKLDLKTLEGTQVSKDLLILISFIASKKGKYSL
jgi:hypothetical protein